MIDPTLNFDGPIERISQDSIEIASSRLFNDAILGLNIHKASRVKVTKPFWHVDLETNNITLEVFAELCLFTLFSSRWLSGWMG